jgi:hypothetical protein
MVQTLTFVLVTLVFGIHDAEAQRFRGGKLPRLNKDNAIASSYIFSGREMPSVSRTSARVSFVFKTKYKSSASRSEPITFTSR